MRKAAVIYYSKFGNTERIAKALSEGMKKEGVEVDCLKLDKVDPSKLAGYELLVIGAPTHGLGVPKAMRELLNKLEDVDLQNKKAFAFDTRLKSPSAGSAAKGIEKQLKKLQMAIVKPYVSAMVKGGEGPLEEGEEDKFMQIGSEIAKT